MGAPHDGDQSWFDKPRNVNLIVWTLVLACLGVMVGGEFIHKHGHFPVEYTVPDSMAYSASLLIPALFLQRFYFAKS